MPHVTIIGGGLAGMAAALRLAQAGCAITLLESTSRLGGKAGADRIDGRTSEHGYHIFPAWYRNVWDIVDHLKLRDSFIDATDFYQLRPGTFPNYKKFSNLT